MHVFKLFACNHNAREEPEIHWSTESRIMANIAVHNACLPLEDEAVQFPDAPFPYDPQMKQDLLYLINFVFKAEYPGSACSRGERPHDPMPMRVVVNFPGTDIPDVDESFVLKVGRQGPMVQFPLASHAIRSWAMVHSKMEAVSDWLDSTDPAPTSLLLRFEGGWDGMYVNFLSTGLGHNAKFLVFYCRDIMSLARAIDTILPCRARLARSWWGFDSNREAFMRRRREAASNLV